MEDMPQNLAAIISMARKAKKDNWGAIRLSLHGKECTFVNGGHEW